MEKAAPSVNLRQVPLKNLKDYEDQEEGKVGEVQPQKSEGKSEQVE